MNAWRSLVLVVAVASAGAVGTLTAGAVAGMPASDLEQLLVYLVPAIAVTAIAALLAGRLLVPASSRQRMLAMVLVAPAIALANLTVLTRKMFVSEHDATVLVVLLAYAFGAGIGAALVVSRASARALRDMTGGTPARGRRPWRPGGQDPRRPRRGGARR